MKPQITHLFRLVQLQPRHASKELRHEAADHCKVR